MHMKTWSAKWRPFCLGLSVLSWHSTYSLIFDRMMAIIFGNVVSEIVKMCQEVTLMYPSALCHPRGFQGRTIRHCSLYDLDIVMNNVIQNLYMYGCLLWWLYSHHRNGKVAGVTKSSHWSRPNDFSVSPMRHILQTEIQLYKRMDL